MLLVTVFWLSQALGHFLTLGELPVVLQIKSRFPKHLLSSYGSSFLLTCSAPLGPSMFSAPALGSAWNASAHPILSDLCSSFSALRGAALCPRPRLAWVPLLSFRASSVSGFYVSLLSPLPASPRSERLGIERSHLLGWRAQVMAQGLPGTVH